MTLDEYIEEQRKRVDNMTLAQARDYVSEHLGHSDMRVEFDKAIQMLLDCADEAIQNKVPEKVQQAYEDEKKDGYVSAKVDVIRAESLIDEIRTEIEEQVLESLSDGGDDWFTAEKVNECLEIIDKYKAESEKTC